MTTMLFILFWVFAIAAGVFWFLIYLEWSQPVKQRIRVRDVVIASVLTLIAFFIRTSEPVQWSLTRKEDSVDSYNRYVSRFEQGRHIVEARIRLDELQKAYGEACAATRPKMLSKLGTKGLTNSLGGKVLEVFVHDRTRGPFTVGVVFNEPTDWPADYREDFSSSHVSDALDGALKDFGAVVGVEMVNASGQFPPFSQPTLMFEYSGEYYGEYKLEGGVLGQTVKGMCLNATVALYKPDQREPDARYLMRGCPGPKIQSSKNPGNPITTWSDMRRSIASTAQAKLVGDLRNELALDEIQPMTNLWRQVMPHQKDDGGKENEVRHN